MSRRKRLIFIHIGAAVAAVAIFLFWRCPIKWITGFSCPGCGVSRAWSALLHGDFAAAFAYHPLFLPAPLLILIPVHMRPLSKVISPKILNALTVALPVLYILVYIVRLIWRDPVIMPDFAHSLIGRIIHAF